MARQIPPRTSRSSTEHKPGNIWSGILIGLLTGLAGAAGLAVWLGHNNPFTERNANQAPQETPTSAQANRSIDTGTSTDKIIDPVTKAAPTDTHFDFYHILPGTPANGAPATTTSSQANAAPTAASTTSVEQMYLQAGAFPDAEQADDLKARLALMGYEAIIQTVTLTDKGTWHRVRLGPYTTADANKIQAVLTQNHITSSLIKPAPIDSPPTN